MIPFLLVQVIDIGSYRVCPNFRPYNPTDSVTEFHVAFLFYFFWITSSSLTIFLTDGKLVFHVLVLYVVCPGKYLRLTAFPNNDKIDFHMLPYSYDICYSCGFLCLYVRTTLTHPCTTV